MSWVHNVLIDLKHCHKPRTLHTLLAQFQQRETNEQEEANDEEHEHLGKRCPVQVGDKEIFNHGDEGKTGENARPCWERVFLMNFHSHDDDEAERSIV